MRRSSGAKTAGRSAHDLLLTRVDLKRSELGMIVGRSRCSNQKPATKALALAEILRRDLMADGASHTVLGVGVLLRVFVERNVSEDLAKLSVQLCPVARHRHVAIGAGVLDLRFGFGMVHVLAPNAGLPVRIARGIRHYAGAPVEPDGDIFPRRSNQAVVTGKAAVGGMKLLLEIFVLIGGTGVCSNAEHHSEDKKSHAPHH